MQTDKLYLYYRKSSYQVYTDTRKPLVGALFFALKGAGFNGNKFVGQALKQGAAYAVADEDTGFEDKRIIRVDNTLTALQQLATYHRQQCKTRILGIGGSNGKTTTKELLKKVLEGKYKVHATPGNFNNHIGLPLTLLSMPIDTEIALVELGTNQKGDIEELCTICQPDLGLITNVGKEHLEGFGSVEAVAHEESFLYRHLQQTGGTAFVNQDDKWLSNMSKRLEHKAGYSVSDFIVKQLAPDIVAQSLTGVEFTANLAGLHNLSNIAAARAVGLHFSIPEKEIATAISFYKPDNMRSEWRQTANNLIFLDAYNANPSSMEVAIQTLQAIKDKPKIAILGDMFELGEHAPAEHKAVYEMALQADFDKVFTVGEEFAKINLSSSSFEQTEDLIAHLKTNKLKGYTVLVKGSRGMKLEQVVPFL